ncbi:MAG: hypothetical protein NZ602_02020 [Thermoguttaceae bacterium]|nr:hypothetical protein [Thermoguttaceae bacterium]MDW8038707.1 hypothetical protein [Thermoguttaceae bacterium]
MKRAAHPNGWQQVVCVLYGQEQIKTIKTFLATYRVADGLIRVVLVREEDGVHAYFATNPDWTVQQILEAAADRGSIEQLFRDVQEVWKRHELAVAQSRPFVPTGRTEPKGRWTGLMVGCFWPTGRRCVRSGPIWPLGI